MRKNHQLKGAKPQPNSATLPTRDARETPGYPLLSLCNALSGYGIAELSERQRSEFLLKWSKRSKFTWQELVLHDKHGLGYEHLPQKKIKRKAPEHLCLDKYMVFRHDGNHSFVGYRIGDVFFMLWAEANYGDVYDHN